MRSVVLALALVAAVFKVGMATRLRVLLPYVGRIGTITLLIAGAVDVLSDGRLEFGIGAG